MKNLMALLLTAGILVLNGCSSIKSVEIKPRDGVKYRVAYIEKDNVYHVTGYGKDIKDVKLKEALNALAVELDKKGVKNFVLTGSGSNNLLGFPINSYKELKRFSDLKSSKAEDGFTTTGGNMGIGSWQLRANSGKYQLEAMPADHLVGSFISLWSVEKTLKDTAP